MSFNLGQFRRDMINTSNYLTEKSYTLSDVSVRPSSEVEFLDISIDLNESLIYGENYYLKIVFFRNLTYDQNITFTLQSDTTEQFIETYFIPKGDTSQDYAVPIELIISPNGSYNKILLTLNRTISDYSIYNAEDNTYGRKINISSIYIAKIENILNTIGHSTLNKIGVQGPPGLLMCINGQDIRIGPNGIYEINNGYKVTFIGFIITTDDTTLNRRNYFILDYQY